MTYEDLVAEFESPQRIGPNIWNLLVQIAGRVCRGYPPHVYADDSQWNQASIEDLAQSVALERLIDESQLDYIFMRSSVDPGRGLGTVEGLLAVQVQRTLAHRRTPSVVDRLIRRIKQLLQSHPDEFGAREIGVDMWIYRPPEPAPRALPPSDRHRGIWRIADIPRIPSNPRGERESKVYGAPQLTEVVRQLCDEYSGLYLSDVRRILEELLTAWLPEILYDSEADSPSSGSQPSNLEVTEMTAELQGLLERLTDSQVAVMIGKSNGLSDTRLAGDLSCSRPTIIKYRRECTETVSRFLVDEVEERHHSLATEILLELAMERGGAIS